MQHRSWRKNQRAMDKKKTKKISGNAMTKNTNSSETRRKRQLDEFLEQDENQIQVLENKNFKILLDSDNDSGFLDKTASPDESASEGILVGNSAKRRRVLQPIEVNRVCELEKASPAVNTWGQYALVTKEMDGMDYTLQIPDELILYIFKMLPKFVLAKCCQVSKRWNKITMDESLWKAVDLGSKTLTYENVDNILSRGVVVARMARTCISDVPRDQVLSVREHQVSILDLSMAMISTDTLAQVLSTCKNLCKLSLESCPVNNDVCRYIAENVNLDTLNLTLCEGISHTGLQAIFQNCTRLQSLNLGWTGLGVDARAEVCNDLPSSVVELNISGLRESLTDSGETLSNSNSSSNVRDLVSSSPQLQSLDISDATSVHCRVLQYIAHGLPNLEHLAISRCYHLLPSSVHILTRLPQLQTLEVFGMFRDSMVVQLQMMMSEITLNSRPFSTIARPTTGRHRTSIWGHCVRDMVKP